MTTCTKRPSRHHAVNFTLDCEKIPLDGMRVTKNKDGKMFIEVHEGEEEHLNDAQMQLSELDRVELIKQLQAMAPAPKPERFYTISYKASSGCPICMSGCIMDGKGRKPRVFTFEDSIAFMDQKKNTNTYKMELIK